MVGAVDASLFQPNVFSHAPLPFLVMSDSRSCARPEIENVHEALLRRILLLQQRKKGTKKSRYLCNVIYQWFLCANQTSTLKSWISLKQVALHLIHLLYLEVIRILVVHIHYQVIPSG